VWVKVVVLPRAVLPVTRNKAIQMRTIILPWYHFRGFFNNQRNIHSVSMRFATFLFGCCLRELRCVRRELEILERRSMCQPRRLAIVAWRR